VRNAPAAPWRRLDAGARMGVRTRAPDVTPPADRRQALAAAMTSPFPIAWPVYAAAIGLVAFATGGLGRIALASSGCLGKSQLREFAAEVAIGILGFCMVLGALSELNAPLQAVIVVVGVLLVAGLVSLVIEVIRAGRSSVLRIGLAV